MVKGFQEVLAKGFESEEDKAKDEWWKKNLLTNFFNGAFNNISASYLKAGGESMSAIRFRMMTKGNLHFLSYIFLKLEPLGTELKTVACYVAGAFLFIELQRVK